MRRLPVALLTLGVSVVLGACANDSGTTSPRGAAQQRLSSAAAAPNACDFNAMKSDAHLFFSAQKDPALSLISDMQAALKTTQDSATSVGWAIHRRIGTARLTSAQGGTAADGGRLVIDVLKCQKLAVPDSFAAHDSLVLAAGIFAIRGDSEAALPAIAWLSNSATQVREVAAPRWGVEPAPTWPTTGRFLVYGYPILVTGTFVTPATAINTNGTGSYNGFELGSVPADQSKANLRVGICSAAISSDTTTANRLLHNSAILVNSSPSTLCTFTADNDLASATTFSSLARRFAQLFMPKDLFADGLDFSSSIGGLPSDWSPFTTGKLVGSQIVPKFTQTPNSRVNIPRTYIVNVTVAGHPVPGVDVKVAITGNNGVPANAIILAGSDTTGTTNSAGDVSFSMAFGKAGGYTMTATGSLTGIPTQSAVSPVFNIKNP
jgi:hypothetical protein